MRRLITLLLVATTITGYAQTKHLNLDKKKLALQGYDPVSYFEGVPEKGKKEWFTTVLGARYRFSNEKRKEQFIEDPKKYLPQYGGWCAYAMGTSGDKVKVDPKSFEVNDGKLYLFFNEPGTNTLKTWNEEGPAPLIKKGDKNWSKTLKGR